MKRSLKKAATLVLSSMIAAVVGISAGAEETTENTAEAATEAAAGQDADFVWSEAAELTFGTEESPLVVRYSEDSLKFYMMLADKECDIKLEPRDVEKVNTFVADCFLPEAELAESGEAQEDTEPVSEVVFELIRWDDAMEMTYTPDGEVLYTVKKEDGVFVMTAKRGDQESNRLLTEEFMLEVEEFYLDTYAFWISAVKGIFGG